MGHTESVLLKQVIIELKKLNEKSFSSGGAGGGTGDASDASLVAILSELKDDTGIASNIVLDANGTLLFREARINQDTGVVTYRYINENGSVQTPVLPFQVDNSDPTFEIITVDLIDDTLNDESNLVNFSKIYRVDHDGTRTLIGTVDEKLQDYTVVGTEKTYLEIGTNAKTITGQLVLSGSNWSPTESMTSFSYSVISVADILNPPVFINTDLTSHELYQGESVKYDLIENTEKFEISNIEITVPAGDIVKVYFTQIA